MTRPILFSGPMVRAILDGKKTQTRRLVTKGAVYEGRDWDPWPYRRLASKAERLRRGADRAPLPCPYGAPGDRLWVRETWTPGYSHASVSSGAERSECEVIYQADNASLKRPAPDDVAEKWDRLYSDDGPDDPRWRPSIHMPRWASRLTLEVVSVRVERLQDITAPDVEREGLAVSDSGWVEQNGMYWTAKEAFSRLWDDINGARAPWKDNPWVWVVTFKRVPEGKEGLPR